MELTEQEKKLLRAWLWSLSASEREYLNTIVNAKLVEKDEDYVSD